MPLSERGSSAAIPQLAQDMALPRRKSDYEVKRKISNQGRNGKNFSRKSHAFGV